MTISESFERLIVAACEAFGARVESHGEQFVLPYDGLYECVIRVHPDTHEILLYSPIQVAGAERPLVLERALALNLRGAGLRGARMCLLDRVLTLRARHAIACHEETRLASLLAVFIKVARFVRQELSSADPPETRAESGPRPSFAVAWA